MTSGCAVTSVTVAWPDVEKSRPAGPVNPMVLNPAVMPPVPEADAFRFGCNAVVVGKKVVTNSDCPGLHDILKKAGYTPIGVELDEFLKAGGSAKCLTLRLDGEETAGWKA